MSIINDALKKTQQGMKDKSENTAPKPGETPHDYTYSQRPRESGPVEQLPASKRKAKSLLQLIFAIAFAVGATAFLVKQINVYIPAFSRNVKTSFLKLMNMQPTPEFKARTAQELVPLAKITIAEPVPAAPAVPVPAAVAPASPAKAADETTITPPMPPKPPRTLNVHGVMSNNGQNIALIDNQVYQAGDEVDGVKIVEINLNSIKVNNNGREETIPVRN